MATRPDRSAAVAAGLAHRDDVRAAWATRRRFLTGTGAAAFLATTGALTGVVGQRSLTPATAGASLPWPFTLGVASGDPLPDAVVIWTRLAPQPLHPFGGMPRTPVPVEWQVATDERFTRVVASGTATAVPERAHAVHVDVTGLEPWRPYFYRFRVDGMISPVGRTRTAPAADTEPAELVVALASCQKWDDGFYTAHRDIAASAPDLVAFVGDYIYEPTIPSDGGVRGVTLSEDVATEPYSIDQYRQRYALHRLDPDLQAAHAAAAWVVTMDDHEVENNWCGPFSLDLSPEEFVVRRANALRVYWEHMPLRVAQLPQGPDMQLYRRLRYGRLAEFSVLDTRQYRSDQVSRGGWVAPTAVSRDPSRTITGATQERWILDGLAASTSRWNLLVQQVLMMPVDRAAGAPVESPMGTWEGYSASRDRILGGAVERGVDNLVVLTGDVHNNFAGDLRVDFADPRSPAVGAELVTTSLSSGGNGTDTGSFGRTILAEGPHVKFHNGQRGYVRCRITPDAISADFRVLDGVTSADGSVSTRATWVVDDGVAGVRPA